jgi:hypothetical protein
LVRRTINELGKNRWAQLLKDELRREAERNPPVEIEVPMNYSPPEF